MDKLFLEVFISFMSGVFIGLALFLFYIRFFSKKRNREIQREVDLILNKAKSKAAKMERLAKQKTRDMEEESQKKLDKDMQQIKEELKQREYKLERYKNRLDMEAKTQEEELKKREEELHHRRELVEIKESKLEKLKVQVEEKTQELNQSLENVASMTKEEAKERLEKALEVEVKKDIAGKVAQIEEEMKKKAEEKARLAVAQIMVRYAAEVTSERTMETIPITGSVTKGKIIGREGRNIRALEAACGVDIIIGESQESINISCFDPVRRAVAKKTLEKLMEEGRVHPALIEEITRKIRKEILLKIKEDGEKACFEAGVHGVHGSIVRVLGSLQYRFIEGQNLLKYSVESASIASLLAGELSWGEKLAKRAGLFHAIGLGVPHMTEGSYSAVGADFCRKHGEEKIVCQAIRCHDGKAKPLSILDHILQCTYNLSRSRSGAKRSVLESHINRLKDLESVANSFDGVTRSYAIKAGKEIRVLVDSAKVLDNRQMTMMGRDIAEKIKREMSVSGEIKVSLIREYRIIEHAR